MTASLASSIEAFNEAFSNQRLDEVMRFFADDAEFRDPYGKVAQGKSEVSAEIANIFSGAYGKLTFIENSMTVDETRKVVCFSWYCQHEMTPHSGMSITEKLTALFIKIINGKTFHWEGIDYFQFNDDMKIVSKHTYGKAVLTKFVRGKPSIT